MKLEVLSRQIAASRVTAENELVIVARGTSRPENELVIVTTAVKNEKKIILHVGLRKVLQTSVVEKREKRERKK